MMSWNPCLAVKLALGYLAPQLQHRVASLRLKESAPEEVCRLPFKLLWLGIAGIFTLVNITVKRLF